MVEGPTLVLGVVVGAVRIGEEAEAVAQGVELVLVVGVGGAALNQQREPALPPQSTTPASQASRKAASTPWTRQTASMFAVLPPRTKMTSWARRNSRMSRTVRLNRARCVGSQTLGGKLP